jgi:hypothetical protein
VNASSTGRHAETPLHWAASSDDVAVLDALLDSGANIEAPGSVIGGGAPLADAVAFGQWQAARHSMLRAGAALGNWSSGCAAGAANRRESWTNVSRAVHYRDVLGRVFNFVPGPIANRPQDAILPNRAA